MRFVRRVSFDNYQPETAVLTAALRRRSFPGPPPSSPGGSPNAANSEQSQRLTPTPASAGALPSSPSSTSSHRSGAPPPLFPSATSPRHDTDTAFPVTPVSPESPPSRNPAASSAQSENRQQKQQQPKPTSILKSAHSQTPFAAGAPDKRSGSLFSSLSQSPPASASAPAPAPSRDPDSSALPSPPHLDAHVAAVTKNNTTSNTSNTNTAGSTPSHNQLPPSLSSGSAFSSLTAKGGRTGNPPTAPAAASKSPPPANTYSSSSSNGVSNNNTLQPPNSGNNLRKKSYSEMSDSELLALDSQFNVRPVDIQKSYGFAAGPRLSSSSLSNCDKDSLDSGSFKNLSPNAILNEYPTKPIITKNSICFNYKHADLRNSDLNDKFYLIMLSSKSYSLSSLDYYINKISSKGDTIVICCSLSTSILGNDKNEMLDEFINSFTNLILSHLENSSSLVHPINITLEFFKSGAFFAEVFNLYQPSLIIVGTNNAKTKSTSMTTANRKLLSVVYVGNDQILNPPASDYSNGNAGQSVKSSNAQVTFKVPFKSKDEGSNDAVKQKQTPKIVVDPPRISHTVSHSSIDSNSSDSNKLSKMKTNDTQTSSLFDNLNDTPLLDLCKTSSNSTSTSYDFLRTDSNSCDTSRRRSMLDVLNSDTVLSKSSSNDDSYQCAIDDSDDASPECNRQNQLGRRTSRSSSGSFENPKPLVGHEKQKQELFEKYQRRLSAVKVGPQASKSGATPTTSNNVNPSATNDKAGNSKKPPSKGSESKSIFKKWFKG